MRYFILTLALALPLISISCSSYSPEGGGNTPWSEIETAKFRLEIVKLCIELMLPITVLIFGFWLNRRLKNIEQRQWTNQKLIEKRLEVFDNAAPLINDLYCYFMRVGNWKEQKPPQVVEIKRKLDRIIYVNAVLFDGDFLNQYRRFVSNFFRTYTGTGQDAKLKTLSEKRKDAWESMVIPETANDGQKEYKWNPEWSKCFDENAAKTEKEIKAVYEEFMGYFAIALEVDAEPNLSEKQKSAQQFDEP